MSHENNDAHTDDVDLSQVIATSLDVIAKSGTSSNCDDGADDFSKLSQNPTDNEPHEGKDDLELENAIGNVFNQFEFNNIANDEVRPGLDDGSHQTEPGDGSGADEAEDANSKADALDEAIGNALKSVMDRKYDDDNDAGDTSLDCAIGDAFKSAIAEETKIDTEEVNNKESTVNVSGSKEHCGDGENERINHIDSDTHSDIPRGDVNTNTTESSHEYHEHHNDGGKSNDDDTKLEDAIGDAFKNIFETASPQPQSEPETSTDKSSNSNTTDKQDDGDDDWNLQNAIGYAFKNAIGSETEGSASKSDYVNIRGEQDHDKANLDEAIGDAFNDIFNQTTSEKTEKEKETSQTLHHDHNSSQHSHESDVDLDEAIGNAFRDVLPQQTNNETNTDAQTDDNDLELAISSAFAAATHEEPAAVDANRNNEKEYMDDSELNQLISASFQKLLGDNKNQNHQDHGKDPNRSHEDDDIHMEDAISQAFKSAMDGHKSGSDDHSREQLDFSNLVQNLMDEMSNEGNRTTESKKASGSSAKNSDQVHKTHSNMSESTSQAREMPQIDDKILAHFQNEAYKEDMSRKHYSSSGHDKSVTNVEPDTAFPSNSLNSQGTNQKEEVLEELQMNDILQNAFNMAMQNPNELLDDLKSGEGDDSTSKSLIPHVSNDLSTKLASTLAKFPHSISSSTASFLESLKLSNIIDWTDRDSTTEGSSTNKTNKNIPGSFGQRTSLTDVNTGKSLEEELKSDNIAVSQMSPQLLNVIGSITSRIANSGVTTPSDANILSVIRTMRNAFSTSLSDSRTTPKDALSVAEIIAGYKNKDERDSMIRSLSLAKCYIDSSAAKPDMTVAKSLIENVLNKFNAEPSIANSSLPSGNTSELISSINNSILSFISNATTTSKYARSTYGEKFKTDSVEYKEKIRIENRERKKKWREENAERNKDNDLRSRVLKRANAMFGDDDSEAKRAWVEEEFGRRREKRIAKQKKDDEKLTGMYMQEGKSMVKATTKESSDLAKDPNLVKPVTDMFNILSASSQFENSQAALSATSIATAAAAAVYTNKNPEVDVKLVNSAVTSILSKLFDDANSSGYRDKLTTFTKGTNHLIGSKNSSTSPVESIRDSDLSSLMRSNFGGTKGFIDRLSRKIKGVSSMVNDNPLLELHHLNLHEKRESDGILPYPKKYKVDEQSLVDSTSRTNSDAGNQKDSGSESWISKNLKMPSYRKPNWNYATVRDSIPDHPTLTLPVSSPFISNKSNFGSTSAGSSNLGLRKPGSFQRPANSLRSKGNGVGFPALYSASYTSK